MADNNNNNPGNFANRRDLQVIPILEHQLVKCRSKEEVNNIAQKGGQSSHKGGFASMDVDKQKDVASKDELESSGSFDPSSEKANEASRKGCLN